MPVLVATNVSPMKLIERAGFTKMSALKVFESITSGVLLVSSQMTTKSEIPLLALTSRRYGSTIFKKLVLVRSSLNSNNCDLAALSIVPSIVKNKRRTLILSNADDSFCAVLSPNSTIPARREHYRVNSLRIENISLSLRWVVCKFKCIVNCTSLVATGENQGNELIDVLAINPAMSPFNGIYLNVLLNLSNVYLYPESNTP